LKKQTFLTKFSKNKMKKKNNISKKVGDWERDGSGIDVTAHLLVFQVILYNKDGNENNKLKIKSRSPIIFFFCFLGQPIALYKPKFLDDG
jgi:hypothetical protein